MTNGTEFDTVMYFMYLENACITENSHELDGTVIIFCKLLTGSGIRIHFFQSQDPGQGLKKAESETGSTLGGHVHHTRLALGISTCAIFF